MRRKIQSGGGEKHPFVYDVRKEDGEIIVRV